MTGRSRRVAGPPWIVVVAGPTAVGKSTVAIALAQALDAEIISADSRQVYRHLNIGTAKVPAAERRGVPHHLIDLVDPGEPFSLAQYQTLAFDAIRAIWSRGRLPVLVGGTGLYIKAVVEGYDLPEVPPDWAFRERLKAEAEHAGAGAVHRRLQAVDPAAAARIDSSNLRRVIRALEVHQATGRLFSEFSRPPAVHPLGLKALAFGLTREWARLTAAIDERVDQMMADGFLDEVRSLAAMGFGPALRRTPVLGYAELLPVVEDGADLCAAVALVKGHTRRYAKRQQTWFRNQATMAWIDVDAEPPSAALEGRIRARLAEITPDGGV